MPTESINSLAETPGFATFEATKDSSIIRLEGRVFRGEEPASSRPEPYHVRAGKDPYHPAGGAGSMPRAAGSAAGGRVGGAPARDAAMDAEEFIGVVGL